jgi:ABC-2 type transport system ATP-binding protein
METIEEQAFPTPEIAPEELTGAEQAPERFLAIITRNLCRRYGKTHAVDNLNLKVAKGSLYGLIGPNGAGKTTSLRMLAGLLEPSSGEIRVNDLPIRQYWHELQWQIGYMPDFFGVYEDLLVWEYLDFFARCYKIAPNRRKRLIDELLELVDLVEKRDAYVHTLSRGMLQRLCLAHTLVNEPSVLLLDEPASGLDPRARVEMRELLRELSRMGKTIVLSSHILTELAELCDTVGIMDHGHLIASGSMDEIRQHVESARRMQVRVLSRVETAAEIIRQSAHVADLFPITQDRHGVMQIEFLFNGNDETAASLVDALIESQVRIASFSEQTTDLEEIFLHLTDPNNSQGAAIS